MSSQQQAPEPDWRAIGGNILEILVASLREPSDRLEDFAQDALCCMIAMVHAGERIDDFVGFGVAVARRRWVDALRTQRRRGERLEQDLDDRRNWRDEYGTLDWSVLLKQAGWMPTEAWTRILGAIASGARGTSKIAAVLGRDVKTIRESRRRLQRWLQEKRGAPPSP